GFDRGKDDLEINALLARDGVHKIQQIAVHRIRPPSTALFEPAAACGAAKRRPLKSTTGTRRASRTSPNEKSNACSTSAASALAGAAARFALTLAPGFACGRALGKTSR